MDTLAAQSIQKLNTLINFSSNGIQSTQNQPYLLDNSAYTTLGLPCKRWIAETDFNVKAFPKAIYHYATSPTDHTKEILSVALIRIFA